MIDDVTDRGSPLGASSRALLDAARPGMSPDADAARRMRAKIAASVAGTAASGGGVKMALATKLGISSLLAVVVVGAILSFAPRGFAMRRAPDEPTVAPPRVVAPIAVAPHVEPVVPPSPAVAPVDDLSAVEILKTPRRPSPVTRGSNSPDPGQPIAKPATTPLAREVELIDRAMAALRTGDPRSALVAIRDYDTETAGSGQLAEDAAAIQVEALCAVKDPTAVTKLATFDQRYPRSAQRSRLNDACTR